MGKNNFIIGICYTYLICTMHYGIDYFIELCNNLDDKIRSTKFYRDKDNSFYYSKFLDTTVHYAKNKTLIC